MLLQLKMGFMLSDKFIDCSDFSPTELPAIKSSHWLIPSFMMVSMLKDVFILLLDIPILKSGINSVRLNPFEGDVTHPKNHLKTKKLIHTTRRSQ